MNKPLKVILIALAALVVLLVAAVAFIVATFNPNDHKPELIKLVKEQTGRTLSIPGEIRLTLFPRIGADLGQISLSE
ncbi:MAG: AsmA family protein, partial [Hylemonella sp.]